MNQVTLFVLVACLAGGSLAGKVNLIRCDGKNPSPLPEFIDVEGCNKLACIIHYNTSFVVKGGYKLASEAQKLNLKVVSKFPLGTQTEVAVPEEYKNVCAARGSCPAPNEVAELSLKVPAFKLALNPILFPKITISLTDENGSERVCGSFLALLKR